MKIGIFWFALAWFLGSTYLGYRLTERSFAELDKSGAPASDQASPAAQPIDLEALRGKVPPALLEKAKTLNPGQLLCLQASISPARVSAVLAGDLTLQEAAAVKKCLE